MTEYARLLMREPDQEDLDRYPDAIRVIESEDTGIVWACTREELEALRDLCDEALRLAANSGGVRDAHRA